MDIHLSQEIREGLNRAERTALHRKNRMRVHAGDEVFQVLRAWDGGFALDLENAPFLRGLVDLYDGARHLYQCLIICSANEGREMIYEYKRQTAAVDAPPRDYAIDENAPVGLLR